MTPTATASQTARDAEQRHPRLDDVIATPDHRARHSRNVNAEPAHVWEALLTAGVDTHPVVRFLTDARNLPRRRRPHAPPRVRTLVEMAPHTLVAVVPGCRVIIGGVGQPWKWRSGTPPPPLDLAGLLAFDAPGWVKMAMDFEITRQGAGSTISTETRVAATSPGARRSSSRYWTVIRLPSALLRRIMLATIAAQAERSDDPTAATPTIGG